MTATLTLWISWIYLATNTVRIVFYAPQIMAVFRARDGASSVAISTWAFWTFANLTALLYGWMVIHDAGFTLIFAGNFFCTGVVTLVALHKRLTHHRLTTH
jgi:hypothetical protein